MKGANFPACDASSACVSMGRGSSPAEPASASPTASRSPDTAEKLGICAASEAGTSVNLDQVAGHVNIELLESSQQVGFEVAYPRPVVGTVVDVDDQQVQPIVVPAVAVRPGSQGGIRTECERSEVADDLGQRIRQAPRTGIGDQPSVVELGRQQDLIATLGHIRESSDFARSLRPRVVARG